MNGTVILLIGIIMLFLGMPSAFAEQVGGGDILFSPNHAKAVVFSHEKHVKGRGLKCMGCHYQISKMARGSYKIGRDKITKSDFCAKCHNGQKAFDVQDPRNCDRCHK